MMVAAIFWLAGGCRPPPATKPKKSPDEVMLETTIKFHISRLADPMGADVALIKLMRIGDPAVPYLIDELDSKSWQIRTGSYQILEHIAYDRLRLSRPQFAYSADAPRKKRLEQIQEIKQWWKDRNAGTGAPAPAPDGAGP